MGPTSVLRRGFSAVFRGICSIMSGVIFKMFGHLLFIFLWFGFGRFRFSLGPLVRFTSACVYNIVLIWG